MGEAPGPETLMALVGSLHGPVTPIQIEALSAHAQAWESERREHRPLPEGLGSVESTFQRLREELAAAQKKVEILEQDRQWWKDNAIRRHKRAAARRAGPGE